MRFTLRIIAQWILFGLSATFTIWFLTYAAWSIPDSPITWVPVWGMFMQYFNQILVDTGTTTTGVVKNSAKTDQIATTTNGALAKWNGSKLVDAWWVYLDGSNKLVVWALQVSGWNSGDVMISDANWNVHWASVDSIISSQTGLIQPTLTKSCAQQPNYPNATFTTGVPTSVDQAWVQWASSCGFTCINGYTGNTCNTAPAPVCKWEEIPVAVFWWWTRNPDTTTTACTQSNNGQKSYYNGTTVVAICKCDGIATPSMGTIYLSNTSGNDLSNPNGTIYTNKQLYVILDGVDKSNPPKGCAKLKGSPGCDNPARDYVRDGDGFRNYYANEWVTSTRIVSNGAWGIPAYSFPAGEYEFYSLYGTTITKVWYGKLIDPQPIITTWTFAWVCWGDWLVDTEYYCGWIPSWSGWVPQNDGCYHRCLWNISGGRFAWICGWNWAIDTEYKCATPNYGWSLGFPWVDQWGGCYHKCL